jgi:hypothetical protein
MRATSIRAAAAVLVLAAALAGAAFGSSSALRPAARPDADGFGSFGAPSAVHPAAPLYRERTVRTSYRVLRVPCAEDNGAACFATR